MSDDLARRSLDVFRQALDLEPNRRAAFVAHACADDAGLRRRVESLVAAVDRSSGFLETPMMQCERRGGVAPAALAPGDVVGGYEITAVIGVGGMGTVYEARQERPSRRVALKVMQRGMVTREARRRFEFEVEILARLRHPGIAQIFEAGTHDDGAVSVPWFAMEHIPDARPISEYVRGESLELRDRLVLFAAVCDAVQHGHQKGVVHRDLKPGNILVDADGQPKVIDFGIARLTDPEQASITRESGTDQIMGTLNYMSPEQCGGGTVDLDVRADVYSLGVVLYELVCRRLPHALADVPLVEALRIIQVAVPARPAAIHDELRGDVEAIVLKALEKDRERRYPSAGEFARDIRHHLDDEMIEARPLTLGYQVQLFTRRYRSLIVAALVLALTIAIGVLASVSFAIRAGREASRRQTAELTAIAERDVARWQAYVASVGAAFYAYESGEFRWMRRRLREAPPTLRGWEWRFLDALAEPSLQRHVAHDDMVFDLAMSADGRRLVTCSRDGTLKVWDRAMLAEIATCRGHSSWVMEFALSPDEDRIVSASWDGTVRVWDAGTGEELLVIPSDGSRLASVDWGPGDDIASGSMDGLVRIWNATTGAAIDSFATVDGLRSDVSYSNDDTRMATWGDGPMLTLRDAASRTIEDEIEAPGVIKFVAWSRDDGMIAVATRYGTQVLDSRTGRVLHELDTGVLDIKTLVFFAGDTRLASGKGRSIVLWDLASAQPIVTLNGHEETVAGVAFSQDERRLYSASWDRTIRVWDPRREGPARVLRGHEESVLSTAFSPDGTLIASASNDGTVRLWNAATGEPIRTIRAHDDQVRDVSFAPDGTRLATASHDDTVRLWEVPTGRLVTTLVGHEANVGCVAFHPDGRRLASGSSDTMIRLWDVESEETLQVLDAHDMRINGLAFSTDGALLAAASRDAKVSVWDTETGTLVHLLVEHASDVFDVVFSRDGRRLYSGARDQTVRVWDIVTGACLDPLDGHGQLITSLALSPDGTRLAGGSWFHKIVLWDVATGDHVATLMGHEDTIRSIAFDPSGRRLVSGAYDRTVRIWDSMPR